MMSEQFVIDASMGARDGMLCFCPVEISDSGQIESVVIGMNYVGSPPDGGKVIAVVHEDGQEAVEQFCQDHADLIAEFIPSARKEQSK